MIKIKILTKFILLNFVIFNFAFADLKYQDITKEHWAYAAIENLVKRGVIKDNSYKFLGDEPITRYEAAVTLSDAINSMDSQKINKKDIKVLENLVKEFSQELNKIGFDANSFTNKIENINETIDLLQKRLNDNEAKIESLTKRIESLERKI